MLPTAHTSPFVVGSAFPQLSHPFAWQLLHGVPTTCGVFSLMSKVFPNDSRRRQFN
jgi:hypothetical protein